MDLRELIIEIDERRMHVTRASYIASKVRQFHDLGYVTVTDAEVDQQISAILTGQPLNILGQWMKSEVISSSDLEQQQGKAEA